MTPSRPSLRPLYIGGSPCCGKTSISKILQEKHNLPVYTCDDAFWQHNEIVTATLQPTFRQVMGLHPENVWMRPVDQQILDELEIYREEFPLITRDAARLLLEDPARRLLLEGAALLPELIDPLLQSARQAIWLIPTRDFQIEHYRQRAFWPMIVKETSDPEQAFKNWMDRDAGFAREVRAQAERRGLRLIIVDGSQPLEQISAQVEDWLFG
jgi:hypothetical protein